MVTVETIDATVYNRVNKTTVPVYSATVEVQIVINQILNKNMSYPRTSYFSQSHFDLIVVASRIVSRS